MPKAVFVNAFTCATVNGNIDITFTQGNVTSPITFTATAAILKGDEEKTIARKLWLAIDAALISNNAKYSGSPAFLTDTNFPFTFQVIKTDHILSVWSEADFDLEVTDNTCKAFIALSSAPIFGTAQQITELASTSGVKLLTTNGTPMSIHTLATAAAAASSKIVSMMNGFNIIPSTYLQVESGEWQRGVQCRYAPVISRSPVLARGPYTPNYLNFLSISTVQRVEFDPYTGSMFFLDWSNSIGIREATDFGNAILWSYVAGYQYVAESLAQIAVQVLGYSKAPIEVDSFKGASFSLTFRDPQKANQLIMQQLSQFAV